MTSTIENPMINESIVAKLFGLEGRTALITGAAAGIGREIAMLFAHAGAKVIGADINVEALSSLVGAINAGGRANQAIGLRLDQGDPSSITTMFQAVRDQAAGLDVLVNCAAIYPFKPFEDVDSAFFDRNIGINLRGVFICTQEAVRIMKRGSGGSIINIASVNAVKACVFDNIHYGAAKAAVNNITISIALEYGSHNIRANSIMPGSIVTENAIKSAVGNPRHGPITSGDRIPLGRRGQPADVAAACLFLASEASSYVTGQLIAVDGGFLIG